MVSEPTASEKEVLAWLIRVSGIAEKALQSLEKGNPYHAIRLAKVISKLDIGVLNVLERVPNYDSLVKPCHLELINECKAILALAQEALKELSPELEKWDVEKRAKYSAIFQELLEELDKELKAEKELENWLSEAEKAFISQEKAWTYSRLYLERASAVLDSLVKDKEAVTQTINRFSKIFGSVEVAEPKKFLENLIRNRLKIASAIKFILEKAFKSAFSFRDHDWLSELKKFSGLPSQNIKELKAIRQYIMQRVVLTKRNVDYSKVSQLLARLSGVSQHARKVERAIELSELKAKEVTKTEEELLREFWQNKVHNGVVYHGTSSIFLQNIERFGLSSEQVFSEGTPFSPEDYRLFLEIAKKAYDADALKYFTQDVTQGFFLDGNYKFAVGYAERGPERIYLMFKYVRDIENAFKNGSFSGRVSQREINQLLAVLQRYESVMMHHRPVVLHIHLSSPGLLAVLQQNGETLVGQLITNYNAFKQYVFDEIGAANAKMAELGWDTKFTLVRYLEKQNPLDRFFHNRPLKGTIPWASVAKAEYV